MEATVSHKLIYIATIVALLVSRIQWLPELLKSFSSGFYAREITIITKRRTSKKNIPLY